MFDKLREKTGKKFIQKYTGGGPLRSGTVGEISTGIDGKLYKCLGGANWVSMNPGGDSLEVSPLLGLAPQTTELFSFGSEDSMLGKNTVSMTGTSINSTNSVTGETTNIGNLSAASQPAADKKDKWLLGYKIGNAIGSVLTTETLQDLNLLNTGANVVSQLGQYAAQNGGSLKGALSSGGVTGAIASAANAGIDMLDNALMGDKTFDAQSAAIDDAVRAASLNLALAGPWGLLAAGVLETANFIDKAAGKTVQGFEVGNTGSGFAGIDTDLSSASYRGSQTRKMKRELARRQEQMNMALTANQINEDEAFLLEARMNSVDNVMRANQMALAGGIDTSLLGG